ncbi:MAG TPA: family 10 glycosylhydrolase [Armatimonadota bacterium]|nr:family 10 glycosylhydrolase [Armatimonadota bacterium]
MKSICLCVSLILMLAFGLAVADTPVEEGGDHLDLTTMATQPGGPWNQPLMPMFEEAAARHDVPLALLITLGYFGSAFENRGDAPTIEGGFGVMALRGRNWMGADSLGEGADLIKMPPGLLKVHARGNINAAAAVLSAYAHQMGIDRSQGLQAWVEPVIKYAGLDEENSRFFAAEVYEKLLTGLDWTNTSGERFYFPPQEIGAVDLSDLFPREGAIAPGNRPSDQSVDAQALGGEDSPALGTLSTDYGPAIWDPAPSCNFSYSQYNKTTVVIHTIQGTAAGARSWMKNCSSNVTSHYVTSEAGGVWQMVREIYTAWHVGCANSYCLGIENEGYAESSSHPKALYDCAGLLTRDMCNSWGITKTRRYCPPGIMGHLDINNCVCGGTHWDPGSGWDWNYFMGVVAGAPPPATWASSYRAQSYPSSMLAGSTAVVWAEFNNTGTGTWSHAATRLGTSSPQDRASPFYNSGNWINNHRPTEVDQSSVAKGQVGRFTFILKAPTTPGTYTEKYRLVQEGVTWFGPEITWSITVTAATGNISGTVTRSGSGEAIPWASVAVSGGPSTTANASGQYSFTGLSAGTYTLTASKDGYETKSASVTVTAGTTTTKNFALVPSDTTAPTVPTNLVATATTPTKISLNWTSSSDNVGVTGYKIYRGGVYLASVPNADGYTDTSCAPSTGYTYTVSAYDASGNNSAQSAPASATTPPAQIIIDNPACEVSGVWTTGSASPDKYGADYIFASTAVTEGKTAIWRPNLASGGTYDVYCWYPQGTNRAVNSPYTVYYYGGSQTVNVNQQANGGQWVRLVSGKIFAAGTSGYVKLGNGTGATGSIVLADAVRFVTVSVDNGPDTIAPSIPTNLVATLVSSTQVDLTWSASSDNVGVAGYKIYRNGTYLASSAGTAYSDTTIVPNLNYTYTVSAYDAADNESAQSAPATTSGASEFRAFWVDAWGSGYENSTATTTMLDYVQSCNANAVLVEMRKRADAYYTSSYEPTATNVTPDPGYDCLADIVTKAHARNLEAHAWVVVNRAWTSQTAPPSTSPEHVYNAHPEWFSLSSTGSKFYGDDSWLDPGHPGVENFYTDVFMEIVQNYDIDGLTLDYIRYPSTNFGYNPTAVARYNAEYGTSGNPSSGNTRWSDWRRDQVTNIVKRIYLEAKAVKPSLKIGAAVWSPAGSGNSGWFQNWDQWMSNHWLDYACPMNYTSDNATFDGDNQDSFDRQYGRHIYPAQGSYVNTISNSMTQIASVQDLGFPGVSLYTYRVTNSGTVDRPGFKNALIGSGGPFESSRNAATMSWIDSPTLGMLKGFVKTGGGVAIYPATVTVQGKSTKNSGTGFYGFVDLETGNYTVTASAPGYIDNSGQVTISAGTVATLDIVLGADTTPPAISSVGTQEVWATNAQVVWNTNEGATSQVEYGLTESYGSSTTEDTQLVTTHTVQLTGLVGNTTYHYRVKSQDGAGNLATSSDYTFATIGNDVVADIIIDNPQATFVGSWFTSSYSTDRYGADYNYCTTQPSEDKSAKWTPSIIVAGDYDIYVWYPQGGNRSQAAPYTCYYNGGSHTYYVNQQSGGGQWNLIGRHNLAAGTAGYVKLGNGTGETALSVMADAVKFSFADTTPPTAPTDLTATAASETQADLTWTASTDNIGVTGYKIYRDSVEIGTSATTSYSDMTCVKAIRYVYEVSAYDASGNESDKSVSVDILMPGGDTDPPSIPEIISANGVSATQIDLAWTTSTDNIEVTGYRIYRDGNEVGTSDTTSYSDTGLAEVTTYSYEVTAYDEAENESAKSTPYQGTTLDDTPPSVPTGLAATPVSETLINLSWTASTDNVAVTDYRVIRDEQEIAVVTTTSYADSGLTPSTTYTYQVSAEDADHNVSEPCAGVQGTTTSDVTPPTVPTGLTAEAVSRSQINLSWNASTDYVGVAGYKVYRDDVLLKTSGTTSCSDTTCWGNTTYSYKVSAYDAKGNESALSSQAVETTPSVTNIIMDTSAAVYVGAWATGTASTDKYGADYAFGSTAATETKTATWTPPIDVSGYYTVYCWYPQGGNRATNSPYTVTWDDGSQTVNVNQQAGGGQWVTLVTNKRFMQGDTGSVKLSNNTGVTGSIVVADAVRFQLISSDLTAPTVPTNLSATAVSASQINLSWTASTDNVGVTGYKIFRNDVQIGTSATTSYQSTGLSQYTTYTYKVAAYDAMDNTSAQSSPDSDTTWDGQAPTVPTGLTGHVIGPRRVSLNWNVSTDNVGVTGYKLYKNGEFLTTSVDEICESGFLTPSTTYTYRVSAYDARGNESAQSSSFQITTPAYANIIKDNPAATYTGVWSTGTSSADKYGADYKYASTAVSEGKTAKWTPTIAYAGYYDIYIWYPQGSNRATNSPFTVYWDGGSQTVPWNQTTNGGAWRKILSNKHFAIGTAGYVKLGNGTGSTGKIVVADAVRFQQVNGD